LENLLLAEEKVDCMVQDNTERESPLRLFEQDIVVLFHITDYYNLDCKHCFINAKHTRQNEYTLYEVSVILSDLKTLKALNVTSEIFSFYVTVQKQSKKYLVGSPKTTRKGTTRREIIDFLLCGTCGSNLTSFYLSGPVRWMTCSV
jgi:hypothetical protein